MKYGLSPGRNKHYIFSVSNSPTEPIIDGGFFFKFNIFLIRRLPHQTGLTSCIKTAATEDKSHICFKFPWQSKTSNSNNPEENTDSTGPSNSSTRPVMDTPLMYLNVFYETIYYIVVRIHDYHTNQLYKHEISGVITFRQRERKAVFKLIWGTFEVTSCDPLMPFCAFSWFGIAARKHFIRSWIRS